MELKKILSQVLFYGMSTMVSRFIYFLLTPIYLSIFSPADYGVVSDVYSIAAIILILLPLGIESGYFRYAKEDEKKFANTGLWLVMSMCVIYLVFSFFFFPVLIESRGYDGDYLYYFYIMSIFICLDTLSSVPFSRLRYLDKAKKYSSIKLIGVGLNVILVILFLLVDVPLWHYLFEHKVLAMFIANALSSLLVFIMLLPNIISFFSFKNRHFKLSKLLVFSLPIWISGLLYVFNQNIDKQMILFFLPGKEGLHQLGIYAGNYKLGVFIILAVQSIRLTIDPLIYKGENEQKFQKTFTNVIRKFTVSLIIIFIAILLFLDPIKRIFIPNEEFWEGVKIVPLLMLANILFGLTSLYSYWYKRIDKPIIGTYLSLIGMCVVLTINYFGILKWGYIACVWSIFISYLLMITGSIFMGIRSKNILYLDYFSLIIFGVLIVFVCVMEYLLEIDLLYKNIVYFFFVSILFYKERKTILDLIKFVNKIKKHA